MENVADAGLPTITFCKYAGKVSDESDESDSMRFSHLQYIQTSGAGSHGPFSQNVIGMDGLCSPSAF